MPSRKRRNLYKYVKDLAKANDITVKVHKDKKIFMDDVLVYAYASIEDGKKVIHIPPVRGGVTFALACHEIGHHVCDGQDWGPTAKGGVLEEELGAWLFSKKILELYEVPWTLAVANIARVCMTQTALDYKAKKKKLPKLFESLIKLYELGF